MVNSHFIPGGSLCADGIIVRFRDNVSPPPPIKNILTKSSSKDSRMTHDVILFSVIRFTCVQLGQLIHKWDFLWILYGIRIQQAGFLLSLV